MERRLRLLLRFCERKLEVPPELETAGAELGASTASVELGASGFSDSDAANAAAAGPAWMPAD